ncbi:ArpU family phage packaging/lysis transcriptional regulator [Enterococcus sp.]|uniref:ArpU family phage packaging/lysis transcriptional regulator n=1 Tax=Enterococcus sp. TaxID=35783 RepID=UPI0028A1F0F7|nr:ArpU family phage packaging/lysis transcriptional regulator [Enterococcus sp.]
MDLLELEIDVRKTLKNAREILKKYRSLKRMIAQSYIDSRGSLSSKTFSDMPINRSNENIIENHMINRLDNAEKQLIWKRELEMIEEASSLLTDLHKELIERTYFDKDEKTQSFIAEEIGFSIRGFERRLTIAVIEFAEAYKGGELIVWK